MDIQGDDKSEAEADGSEQEIRDHGRSGLRVAGFPRTLVLTLSDFPSAAPGRPAFKLRRIAPADEALTRIACQRRPAESVALWGTTIVTPRHTTANRGSRLSTTAAFG